MQALDWLRRVEHDKGRGTKSSLDMKSSADVVVIGAGVQGLSAAYHLAKIGIHDVVVVEKAFIGAGASGRSASMLMLQVWSEWQIRFSQYCFEHFMHFEDEFGIEPGYERIGTLTLVTENVAEQEKSLADLRRQLGAQTETWSPEEVKQRYPVIHTDDLVCGVFGPEDGIIDAQSIMLGYKNGATQLGVEVYQGTRATGISLSEGRITGVQTSDGDISTRHVVNAGGADAAHIGAWLGLDIPINNRLRNIFVTDKFDAIPDNTPFVYDAEAEWYYRKEKPGVLIGMGKRESKEQPMAIDWNFLESMFDVVVHRVPALAEVGIASGWSGLRPLSPDGHPIIGPVDGIAGYINSCGWGGEGIMHSPIGGQLVAEWIQYGEARTFAGEPFLLSRFSD